MVFEVGTSVLYPCVALGCGMRAKIIFATLVGLLFCSLATLEIAELVRLADDTSNDFSGFVSQQASSAVVCQSLELQPRANPNTDHNERTRANRWFEVASHRAQHDVLRLLCIMRT